MLLTPDFCYKDLLKIPDEKLNDLAAEVRQEIINTVTTNGGHLGSSLGVVELTIAMLKTFDPFNDRIIFDVGHQSYPYKILTDRFNKFKTLRLKDGLCGFPRTSESPCDHFNTGHSSTSISAALGYAKARDLLHEKRQIIAFIGDGALINGLALEALNYVKETKTKIIIILNDNKFSISNRVGGFSTILARLSANSFYRKGKSFLRRHSHRKFFRILFKGMEFIHNHAKSLIKPDAANFFDDLDINYWGVFDGHDLKTCCEVMKLAKDYDKPVILHFNTQKGRGYEPAEKDPVKYHQVSPKGEIKSRTWSEAASEIITNELAPNDPKIICLTAAMATGVKLEKFAKKYPSRFFDVGIAESHMLTMAAGLAAGRMRPFVFIYSTFLQRAADQLMHDIALQNLPVVVMVDRAGLVGSDGDTHQGLLDISWARAIPNLEIYTPSDEKSLREIMHMASKTNAPVLIRYPRGNLQELNIDVDNKNNSGIIKIYSGEKIALLGHGTATGINLKTRELAIKKNIFIPAVFDIRRIKPFDFDALERILTEYEILCVSGENYVAGGNSELISEFMTTHDYNNTLIEFEVPVTCIQHATSQQQREIYGITPENIIDTIIKKSPIKK